MTPDQINKVEKVMWSKVLFNKNLTVPWYLITSYAYYVQDDPIISDSAFDKLAKLALKYWSDIDHMHKYLISTGDLEAGSLLTREFPSRVVGSLEAIKRDVRENG